MLKLKIKSFILIALLVVIATITLSNTRAEAGNIKVPKKIAPTAATAPLICGEIITDADGNHYNTVQIGSQCWMKQNLNVGTMIGSKLANNTTPQNQTNNGTIEKYCYGYVQQGNAGQIATGTANCATDGGLYQWAEAVQYTNGATNDSDWVPAPTGNVQGICPTGWHIPTFDEWQTLAQLVDTNHSCDLMCSGGGACNCGAAGNKLKAISWDGTDAYGFSALPSGYRYFNGSFRIRGDYTFLWSASPYSGSSSDSWDVNLDSGDPLIHGNYGGRTLGHSVRCLKN